MARQTGKAFFSKKTTNGKEYAMNAAFSRFDPPISAISALASAGIFVRSLVIGAIHSSYSSDNGVHFILGKDAAPKTSASVGGARNERLETLKLTVEDHYANLVGGRIYRVAMMPAQGVVWLLDKTLGKAARKAEQVEAKWQARADAPGGTSSSWKHRAAASTARYAKKGLFFLQEKMSNAFIIASALVATVLQNPLRALLSAPYLLAELVVRGFIGHCLRFPLEDLAQTLWARTKAVVKMMMSLFTFTRGAGVFRRVMEALVLPIIIAAVVMGITALALALGSALSHGLSKVAYGLQMLLHFTVAIPTFLLSKAGDLFDHYIVSPVAEKLAELFAPLTSAISDLWSRVASKVKVAAQIFAVKHPVMAKVLVFFGIIAAVKVPVLIPAVKGMTAAVAAASGSKLAGGGTAAVVAAKLSETPAKKRRPHKKAQTEAEIRATILADETAAVANGAEVETQQQAPVKDKPPRFVTFFAYLSLLGRGNKTRSHFDEQRILMKILAEQAESAVEYKEPGVENKASVRVASSA